MGASTPEGKVKEKVKDFLKEARIWYFMPANNGYGTSGIPDFVCVVEGILWVLSAKLMQLVNLHFYNLRELERFVKLAGRGI